MPDCQEREPRESRPGANRLSAALPGRNLIAGPRVGRPGAVDLEGGGDMKLELTPSEVELLDTLLDTAGRERQRQIHHAQSHEYRNRLERDAELMEAIRSKLAATTHAA